MTTITNYFAKHLRLWRCLVLLMFGFGACQSKNVEPTVSPYTFVKPDHFPETTYTFDNNPVSEKGFKLGKKLFFDPILSVDNSISCNSCHNQAIAFADLPLHPVSVGVNGRMGTRNAPPLQNLAFRKDFFWDGGVTHLDFTPLNAIESHVEMAETIKRVIQKLNQHPEYPQLFKDVFGLEEVTTPQLLHVLSQFMNMTVSSNSRYDAYLKGEVKLSTQELQGLVLFEKKCQSCHAGILFTDDSFRNNGISQTFEEDKGRARITALESDIGKFRVPSLRNIAVTAPYMHNAQFKTLEEVLNHYGEGVKTSSSLDSNLIDSSGRVGIRLTEHEKTAIIGFLNTLTDTDFLSNPIFHKGRD